MSHEHMEKTALKSATPAPAPIFEEEKKLDAQALMGMKDSLESQSRLIDTMKMQTEEENMAPWVHEYKTPSKATLEASYEESIYNAFGSAALVESHKSKRKSHYMDKAKVQTSASSMVNTAYAHRKLATDAFLSVAPRVKVAEEDVSFMQDWSTLYNTGDYANGQLSGLADIFSTDLKKQGEQARSMSNQILFAELSEFEYKNDNDFLQKFADKYKIVCAYSNADKIISMVEGIIPEEREAKLRARVRAFKDIREDYENKMQIMQSPYYALLMSSDLENQNLERVKLEKKDNPTFMAYYNAVQKRKEMKFGKGQSANELEQKYLEEETQKAKEATTDVEESAMKQEHAKMLEKEQELRSLKGASDEPMQADTEELIKVKISIAVLNAVLSEPIEKGDKFKAAQTAIIKNYQDVIDNCKAYSEKYGKDSKETEENGIEKKRLELIEAIRQGAENEMAAFSMSAEQLNIDVFDTGAMWTEVLYNIRATDASESDPHVTKVGAGSSVVYRVEDRYGTSYLKEESRTLMNITAAPVLEDYRKSGAPEAEFVADFLLNAFKEKYHDKYAEEMQSRFSGLAGQIDEIRKAPPPPQKEGESIEEYEARVKRYKDSIAIRVTKAHMKLELTPELLEIAEQHWEALTDFASYYDKKGGEHTVARENGINPGSVMSNRNVSTSRIAERLHMTDVVAKSQTVMMKKDNGQMVRANSMEGVETKTMQELKEYCLNRGLKINLSGKAVKQYYSLQMMDVLCAQIDRHHGNLSVFYEQTDEHNVTVTSIKAIDNDMSFGDMYMAHITTKGNMLSVYDDLGLLSVPYLDKEFYDSLMAYEEEDAAHDQLDLRSPEEIESLKVRLRELKKSLGDRLKEGKLTLLQSDDQWDAVIPKLDSGYRKKEIGMGYPMLHRVLGM